MYIKVERKLVMEMSYRNKDIKVQNTHCLYFGRTCSMDMDRCLKVSLLVDITGLIFLVSNISSNIKPSLILVKTDPLNHFNAFSQSVYTSVYHHAKSAIARCSPIGRRTH